MIAVKPPFAYDLNRGNPLTRGVVGAWFFTEGAGLRVNDISGYGNHGTRSNWAANTGWAGGPSGWAMDFNEGNGASADCIINCGSASVLDDLTEFSFICRFYPKSQGRADQSRLFAKSTQKNLLFSTNTSRNIDLTIVRATTNASARTTNNTLTLNAWQTVATRWASGSAPQLYHALESAQLQETVYSGTPAAGTGAVTSDASGDFCLGNRPAADRPLDGLMNWAIIYNRLVSIDEFREIHRNPFSLISQNQPVTFWDIGGGGGGGGPVISSGFRSLLGVGR